MENKKFKTIVNECLLTNGFLKKGKYYYKESPEVICVLGLQKSNYSNCYYVNVGIVIKKIYNNLELPRDVDGHIRSRFYFTVGDKQVECLNLDEINEDSVIISSLEAGISEIINPALEHRGLEELLKKKRVLLYETTVIAKQYLGINE
ncbi:hypothetical protein C289_0095 [Anoxybacillus ayderensis]|uniref:DUF4304 domain-containing protein n=1 Tax=Anoxybacillus ayderensis TaxID=265546 RepID=UPI0003862352|nr:DUF4304 domain-containing protein [Anoxybacillus ayderensis]EPZ39872.1 hypothetical protein C289_0095 [Anoxybacillus ayderensis]